MNKNIKILVVDDMPQMRKINRLMLKQLGFNNIKEANNGQKAIEMLQEIHDGDSTIGEYELILLDLNMPDISGLDVLEKIKSDSRLKQIPVIVISAENEKETVVKALKLGINDYIIKPFNTDTLQERLEKLFNVSL